MVTTADQILSSASNAVMFFALAQVVSVAGFGIVTLFYCVFLVVLGFTRGALGTPILLAADLRSDDVLAETGYALTWSVLTGAVAVPVLLGFGFASGSVASSLAFSLAMPGVLIQDVLRFAAISIGRPQVALCSDGIWTVFMCALFALNRTSHSFSAEASILFWGLGGIVAAAYSFVALKCRPRSRLLFTWWRTYARSRKRFGSVQALTPASVAAIQLGVAVIAGAAIAGALRGASTIFGPIAMLVSALPLVFVPHARRTGQSARAQWQLLKKISLVTSAGTTFLALIVLATPLQVGTVFLGETWGPAAAVVPFTALNSLAGCWMTSIYALFQALAASRASFHLRNLQLVLQLGASICAAAVFGTAVAIAGGLAGATWLCVVVGVLMSRRVISDSASAGEELAEPAEADQNLAGPSA